MAVDQMASPWPCLPQSTWRRQVAISLAFGGRAATFLCCGSGLLLEPARPDDAREERRCLPVRDTAADDLGGVVVDHGGEGGAIDAFSLGEILKDGEKLDPLTHAGRCHALKMGDGGGVGCLIEKEKPGRVKRFFRRREQALGKPEVFLHEGREK